MGQAMTRRSDIGLGESRRNYRVCSSTSNRSSRHWSASSATSRISTVEHGLCACSGYPLQYTRSPLMHSESTATQEALRAVFCTQLQRLHLQTYVITGFPKLSVDCVME